MTAPAVALAPVLIDGTGAGAMPGTTSLHGELLNRAVRDDYQQWLTSVAPAARCVRPILLGGRMHEVGAATGEIPFTLDPVTARPGDLHGLRRPPRLGLPVLRRDLPARHLSEKQENRCEHGTRLLYPVTQDP
jgi:hypothetical protein